MFNLYSEYIIRMVGVDEMTAGLKFKGWNANPLRYADDTPLLAKNKGDLANY